MRRPKMTKTRIRGVHRIDPQTFRIRLYLRDPKTGRDVQLERVVTARNLAAAAEERARIRREWLAERTTPARGRERLRTFATSWLASKLPELARTTAERWADVLERHVLSSFGDWYIDAITLGDFVAWRDGMSGGAETINTRVAMLRRLMRAAAATHRVAVDPSSLRGVRVPRRDSDDDSQRKSLTVEQVRATLDALRARHLEIVRRRQTEGRRWYPVVLTLALTGLRFSEVAGLQWRDIDAERGVIRIRRAAPGGQLEDDTKTTSSRRTVALAPELAEVLEEHRRWLIASQAPGVDSGLVFPSAEGTPMFTSVMTKPVRAAMRTAGVHAPSFHCAHGWRHSFHDAIRKVTSGVVARALVGHATEAMSDRYAHVSIAERQAAVSSITRLIVSGGTEKTVDRTADRAIASSDGSDGSAGFQGGRCRDRTCDFDRVKVATGLDAAATSLDSQGDRVSERLASSRDLPTEPRTEPRTVLAPCDVGAVLMADSDG